MAALAALDDKPAAELARRFEGLPEEQQADLWRMANRQAPIRDLAGHESELARTVAEKMGWSDLAAAWPR